MAIEKIITTTVGSLGDGFSTLNSYSGGFRVSESNRVGIGGVGVIGKVGESSGGSTDDGGGDVSSEILFTSSDYWLFVILLLLSGLIGVYYGFFSKRKQNNPAEYILGNQQMSIIPIAASLIVSHISGISMLAVPAEIYANGTQYVMTFICLILVGLSLVYIYIPVFYDLSCPSCFLYLEKRFGRKVRITASLVYTFNNLLFMPIVIYVPALAFNQVSGIRIEYITIVICALCIFYTTLGGLRAVVWTDTIQYVSIVGAVLAVMIVGTIDQGGLREVFEAAERGGRLIIFDMRSDPTVRTSFWTVTIGLSVMWISLMSASQGTIQRFLSLPSKQHGTRCVILFITGMALIKTATVYVGILLYAKYEGCDPLTAGNIKKIDQILPYYALHIFKDLPGLTGIFIAGIFSAALSTMSSSLNSLAGCIFEDLIKPKFKGLKETDSSRVMKCLVFFLGILVTSLVFVVSRMGAILSLAYSVHGLTAGASLGIFTLGMLSRKVNTKGIIVGALASIIFLGVILIGATLSVKSPTLPFPNEQCTNQTLASEAWTKWTEQYVNFENLPFIFRISFMYYTLIGTIIVCIVAYPVSLMTNDGKCQEIDEKLLAPFMRTKNNNEIKEMNFIKVPLKDPDQIDNKS